MPRTNTNPALATRGSASEFSFDVNEQPNSNTPFTRSTRLPQPAPQPARQRAMPAAAYQTQGRGRGTARGPARHPRPRQADDGASGVLPGHGPRPGREG